VYQLTRRFPIVFDVIVIGSGSGGAVIIVGS
jgi:hypothetical protein